ncbi:MAG: hypothetical protein CMF46_01045 [Legionellales bacterium]|nr:hypothetical protein [Legionellales bacterium]|tara:strand:- start:430 stop:2631 length:2202 start_codon:yes stop_codon:yes gene_type:complete
MLTGKQPWIEYTSGVIFITLAILQLIQIPSLVTIQEKYFDTLQVLYPKNYQNTHTVIIDIDEQSLASIGQWPWNRLTISQLLKHLHDYGVSLVGFDILFSEYDRTSPAMIANQLYEFYPELSFKLKLIESNEKIMAASMGLIPTISANSSSNHPGMFQPQPSSIKAVIGEKPNQIPHYFDHILTNVPEIDKAAAGIGFISLIPEHDGIIRRAVLVNYINENFYPALSAEMVRVAFQGNSFAVKSHSTGIQGLILQTPKGNIQIPTDRLGRTWIHYAEPIHLNPKQTVYVSAADILNQSANADLLKGKIAIVGTSAIGLKDIRATPNTSHMPGVEVHYNILENLIDALLYQTPLISRPGLFTIIEPCLTIVMSLSITLLFRSKSIAYQVVTFLIFSLSTLGLSHYAFVYHSILFDASMIILIMTMCFLWETIAHFLYEEREKKHIQNAFKQYLSPAMVNELSSSKEKLKLGGEQKSMTILLCDIKNFTQLSELFSNDPETLTTTINQILTPLSDLILKHGGTIDKYIGDCIMAFWNAPIDTANHQQRALDAAIEMKQSLPAINQSIQSTLQSFGAQEIGIRIGINTGQCIVGNIGSNRRFDYSVLGDTVNLAARLESLGKTYQTDLLIGEETYSHVDQDRLIKLDRICVKGKSKPVSIYTNLTNKNDPDLKKHRAFLEAYSQGNWSQAAMVATNNKQLFNGELAGYYQCMLERIVLFQQQPPAKWDGVYHLLTK